jgi:hypothetical protein
MRFKKMLVALVACMALTAVTANGAQAALRWDIDGTPLAGSETVTVGTHEGKHLGAWILSGSAIGTTIDLMAEDIECGAVGGCKIEGAGASAATLKFTNVKVAKPTSCTAQSPGGVAGILTTNALKDQIKMDTKTAGSTVVLDEFSPVAAGGALLEIEFSGADCTLAGNKLAVKGTAEGEALHTVGEGGVNRLVINNTGEEFVQQLLRFGSSQQKTGGGTLTLGGGNATLAGTAAIVLNGKPHAGQEFGATE